MSRAGLLALLLATCSAPPRPPARPASPATATATPDGALVVRVGAGALAGDVVRALAGATPPGGDCFFAWGEVGASGARRARIEWAGGALDGRVLCDDAAERAMRDPPVREVVMVGWRGGELSMTHPSDTSESAPLPRHGHCDNPENGIALVVPRDTDPALPLLDALRTVPCSFLRAAWPFR